MAPVYRGGRQLVKVRAVMIFSLVCAVASLWWGIDLAQTYGLSPGDGGVLAPLPVRMAWAAGVGSLGLILALAMWLYGCCYVAAIDYDEQAQKLHIKTVSFLGDRKQIFDVADVTGDRHHEGGLDFGAINLAMGGVSVNAPWQSVRLTDRRLPLIIDEQGEVFKPDLMRKLFNPKDKPSRPKPAGSKTGTAGKTEASHSPSTRKFGKKGGKK